MNLENKNMADNGNANSTFNENSVHQHKKPKCWIRSDSAEIDTKYIQKTAKGCWQGANPRWEDDC